MIKCRCCLGLAFKPLQRLRVGREALGKHLEGDVTPKPEVLCFVNHSHPTAADRLKDAVMRDGLAFQRRWATLKLLDRHSFSNEGHSWSVQYAWRRGPVPQQRFHLMNEI